MLGSLYETEKPILNLFLDLATPSSFQFPTLNTPTLAHTKFKFATMDLAAHQINSLPKALQHSNEKEMLLASISDFSAVLLDEMSNHNKLDPFDQLMSSIRSLVDLDDFPDHFVNDLEDSFNSTGDDSLRELLTEVNDLLHSKETFTLNECTSLETEMIRLKTMKKRNPRQDIADASYDSNSNRGDNHSSTMDDLRVQKQNQKQKLANVLKGAKGGSQAEAICSSSKTNMALLPLNPNRFAENKRDSVPKSPTKRGRSPFRRTNSFSVSMSISLSPMSNDNTSVSESPARRWDSECASPLKGKDSPPKSPRKRAKSPFTGPSIKLSTSFLNIDTCPNTPDAAPKKPIRTTSGRQ
jgi:hypothetical protein